MAKTWFDYYEDHVKVWEGLKLQAYKDVAGVWTIGYGHTGPDVYSGMTITLERAEALLRADTAWAERAVDEAITVPMTPNQKAAFVGLTFNIGASGFKNSTAARRFNAGDLAGSAEALTWWNKARVNGKLQVVQGLVNRRDAERELLLRTAPKFVPVPREIPEEVPSSGVEGGEHKKLTESKTLGAAAAGAAGAATAFATVLDSLKDMNPYTTVAIVVALLAFGYIAFNRYVEWKEGEH